MYIDRNGLNPEKIQMTQVNGDNSPGFAPISPDTPSWGPPPGNSDSGDNSPGFAPISPDTPSWGPPPGSAGGGNNGTVIVIPGQNNCLNCITGPTNQASNVRFLHAAVNQPAVNIRLGNRMVINNMQYGNSTPYYLDNNNQNTLVTEIGRAHV